MPSLLAGGRRVVSWQRWSSSSSSSSSRSSSRHSRCSGRRGCQPLLLCHTPGHMLRLNWMRCACPPVRLPACRYACEVREYSALTGTHRVWYRSVDEVRGQA